MKTAITIFRPAQAPQRKAIELPDTPGIDRLHDILDPILGTRDFEHVYVLHDGHRADMFVDETGHWKGLPRNEDATRIYRTAWMARYPSADIESLPEIVGTAVLFDNEVW